MYTYDGSFSTQQPGGDQTFLESWLELACVMKSQVVKHCNNEDQ